MRRPTRRPHALRRPAVAYLLAAGLGAGVAAACGGESGPAEPPPVGLSAAARTYVEAAVDTMQRHSINRYKIDWASFRAAAVTRAGTAQTPAQTHASLAATVRTLGDNHSGFYTPGQFSRLPSGGDALGAASPSEAPRLATDPSPTPTNTPSGRMLTPRIAYVFVPYFAGTRPVGRADSTLARVRALDAEGGAQGPCGWVVDLRLNSGGNMYPMIAGVGPLIGDGRAGAFVDPDSVRSYWYHRAGTAGMTAGGIDYPAVTVSAPYTLRRTAPPVAVLYGPMTASSGEATAISFRGLPNARSFGGVTYGLTTANVPFRLSDGAILNLTVATEEDRAGRLYGGPLTPDEATPVVTPDPASSAVDAGMQAAIRWLEAQPACAAGGPAASASPARSGR